MCVCVCVCVRVYVCMHACMHACMYACLPACMHVSISVCLYDGMYLFMCVYIYVCVMYVYAYTYTHTYTYIYICRQAGMHVYEFIHTCKHAYIQTYILIHTHLHTQKYVPRTKPSTGTTFATSMQRQEICGEAVPVQQGTDQSLTATRIPRIDGQTASAESWLGQRQRRSFSNVLWHCKATLTSRLTALHFEPATHVEVRQSSWNLHRIRQNMPKNLTTRGASSGSARSSGSISGGRAWPGLRRERPHHSNGVRFKWLCNKQGPLEI